MNSFLVIDQIVALKAFNHKRGNVNGDLDYFVAFYLDARI